MPHRISLWLYRALAVSPLWLAHTIGAAAGLAAAWLPTKPRHVTAVNLRLCLPELGERARRRLTRRSLVETGKAFAEASPLLARRTVRALGKIRAVHGEAHVHEALAAGRGLILATPHLGAWELMGLYCSSRFPITSLYRPLHRTPALDRLVRGGRERAGARLMPTDASGVRALYRALEANEAVGLLPDHNPSQGAGVFVPFFGVDANTPVLMARLAQRTGAPVVFCYAERLARARGYVLHFLPPERAMAEADDLEQAAAAMNRALEALIRRQPEQYYWAYKRFRKRPPGEPSPY